MPTKVHSSPDSRPENADSGSALADIWGILSLMELIVELLVCLVMEVIVPLLSLLF